jgi:hypothetical protein
VVFLSPSNDISNSATIVSFHIPFHLLYSKHPNIQRCTVCTTDSAVKPRSLSNVTLSEQWPFKILSVGTWRRID